MSEKTRYTDAELEEFKQIILEKLKKAEADFVELKKNLTNKEGNDTMDTSPTFKVLEEGANTLSICPYPLEPDLRVWCKLRARHVHRLWRPPSCIHLGYSQHQQQG